ncbi:periplasmic heavy metal sensor [Sulfitobacter sp. F26169L]|uniref:periplasmic heavy metal sensor n=1 Tax=Sulfitobacter sp. F26169L TaxID=2996015 RepID=UPI0022609714|nr:periplasmic heavy metal sensor [Sulfitobacter sp. F26169L]MCX7566467.1 periplasmic heavy metal sensor [Sulfitobacter sp. F26169L]
MADVVRKRRWVPFLLGLSLALNLAVVAAVAGAGMRHHRADDRKPHSRNAGAAYIRALPREARQNLRETLRERRGENGRDVTEMVNLLRQKPFDAAAAAQVFDAQRVHGLAQLEAASAAWLKEVTAMDENERGAYADRLQELSEKRRSRHKGTVRYKN